LSEDIVALGGQRIGAIGEFEITVTERFGVTTNPLQFVLD